MIPSVVSRQSIEAPLEEDAATLAKNHLDEQRRLVRDHYNRVAPQREQWIRRNAYYYRRLFDVLRFIVEPNRRVLQIRSDTGHLLAALKPSYGVGIDVSERLVEAAQRLHPELHFEVQDPENLSLRGPFDYVLVNSVNDIIDIHASLLQVHNVTTPESRVLILGCSYLWRPLIRLAELLKWKVPQPAPNWLSVGDIKNLLALAGFEPIRTYGLFLSPVYFPWFSNFLNRAVARLPFFRNLCFMYLVVARSAPLTHQHGDCSVSVIVPCKNEEGNVEAVVRSVPEMGTRTELVFCDDRSTDATTQEVRRMQRLFPKKDIKLIEGPGICKAQNVWKGFEAATGEVLMILDADLSTQAEELPYFYAALRDGRGEFVNGSRMVYPMHGQAMRVLNILGNILFGWAFTFLLGQRIKDTLCGTKALWRRDYDRIKQFRGSWGIEDRWGDYELLFGAARLHLKIVDLPVHYRERVFGQSKMTKRFRNAWIMARMCWAALWKLKCL